LTAEVQIKGIAGVNEMIRELKQIEPELYKELRKDLISDVKPLYQIIKSRIPIEAPLSGMYNNGRLGWGQTIRVSAKINMRKRRGYTSLLTVKTSNAAVEMVDMAGKASQGKTASGKAMIKNLPGTPSRYVWKAAERYLPQIIESANKTLERYSKIKNRTLEFIPKD
jgi:hypothetical protein